MLTAKHVVERQWKVEFSELHNDTLMANNVQSYTAHNIYHVDDPYSKNLGEYFRVVLVISSRSDEKFWRIAEDVYWNTFTIDTVE